MSDLGGGAEGQVPDLGALLGQLGQMRQQLVAAQEAAVNQVIEGRSGGGAVRVVGTGGLEVSSVLIDRSVVDPAEVDILADLVLAAVRDFVEQARKLQGEAVGGLGLGGGLDGLLGG